MPHRDLSITGHITNETHGKAATCKHPAMMGMWPRAGEPFMYCNACGHTEPMNDERKKETLDDR